MNCCEELPKTVDSISTIKDIALLLLSAIAIFSSYIQHKKTKRGEWIKEFRTIIAKLVATISVKIEEKDLEYHKELFEQFSLVTLYLDEKNTLHTKLIGEINLLRGDLKKFNKGEKNSTEVSVSITNLIKTAKKIIEEERGKIF